MGYRDEEWQEVRRNRENYRDRRSTEKHEAIDKVSVSYYITNLPKDIQPREIWNWCTSIGTIVDVYVAQKLSKMGRRFGFVRFIKVKDTREVEKRLCDIWLGNYMYLPNGMGNGRSYAKVGAGEKPKNMEQVQVMRSMKIEKKELTGVTDVFVRQYWQRHVGGLWVWVACENAKVCGSYCEYSKLPLCAWNSCVFKNIATLWGEVLFADEDESNSLSIGKDKSMTNSLERKDDEGPSLDGGSEHEEPLDVDNCDSDSSKDDNNDSDSPSEMSSTSRLMQEVDVRGVDSDHVDSFEEGEIIGESVLNDDGCVKDCMEKKLDDDNTSIPEVAEDLSSLDKSSAKAERLARHNNGPLSTPPGTDLNLADESCSTWLDYVGPLITDELDSEKHWSYRDPNGNVQGSFSLAQLHRWKDYFSSNLKIWSRLDLFAFVIINLNLEQDIWQWEFDDEETFTVRSVRNSLDVKRLPGAPMATRWCNVLSSRLEEKLSNIEPENQDGLQRMKENGNQTDPGAGYSTGWNARRSLNLLKFNLNHPTHATSHE
ncbi:hypothetical protein CTI12_AA053730 [Artemisia annua]|uniref:RRM domain-containing protein n=1 Tax=Artemisia annua TaxID=35608 RepID=A0A2U1QAL2_ARTAN|nr:hypothetical protein CTI12_AA053730 [Artemisia annua]